MVVAGIVVLIIFCLAYFGTCFYLLRKDWKELVSMYKGFKKLVSHDN